MTSIIAPTTFAKQMALNASQGLDAAKMALVGGDIRPLDPSEFMVGIPEHNGPDTPDNPWFIQPGRPQGSTARAARIAEHAIGKIDQAINYGAGLLSKDVLHAFDRAKGQAEAGVRQLTAHTMRPIDTDEVGLQFDSAKLWLGLAVNLIELDENRPAKPMPGPIMPEPPVTIQPVPMPGEPGAPITIQPVDPITIQLPSPDSPVQ